MQPAFHVPMDEKVSREEFDAYWAKMNRKEFAESLDKTQATFGFCIAKGSHKPYMREDLKISNYWIARGTRITYRGNDITQKSIKILKGNPKDIVVFGEDGKSMNLADLYQVTKANR